MRKCPELMVSRWVTTPQIAMNQSRFYSPQKSPTSKTYRNETFSEDFPSGTVSGIIVEDSVILRNGSAKIPDFAFGFVDQKSAGIRKQPFDGFLGLGFSNNGLNSKCRGFFCLYHWIISSLSHFKHCCIKILWGILHRC